MRPESARAYSWKLYTTNLTPGKWLPAFTPVEADLKKRTIVAVINVVVFAAAAAADTTLKIAKGSLAYKGMFLGDGKKGGEVKSIDTTNAEYDEITFAAAFGADIAKGDVLFEAASVAGTKKKNTANFVLYNATKVESDGRCSALC